MIRKICDVLAEKRPTYSFELFPPKNEKGMSRLFNTVEKLAVLEPDYISVTYGAGGSTSKSTLDIIEKIQEDFELTCMHHFTLVNQTVESLSDSVKAMRDAGVKNVLALRGDPPPEMGDKFRKIDGGLEFCYELMDLVREIYGNYDLSLGVAGFPEVHIDCPSAELDSKYLKIKLDHGADFVVTQLFFENESFSKYIKRNLAAGADAPLIPGVLPIVDYKRLLSFCDTCGAYICEEVHKVFGPIADDPAKTVETGTKYAIDQSTDLLARGAAGIHFYCLNKVNPTRAIWRAVKEAYPPQRRA